ncbi:MAG: glycoside hydrolase family 3 N-terminal domain-containing protein [Bacteroidia bacterium]
MKRFNHLILVLLFSCLQTVAQQAEEKADELLLKLSLEEKISLLGYQNNGVKSLQIPVYNWWNEALHGVARAGKATVFPQAIGMAASFNPSLVHDVADAISTEARAKYNLNKDKNPGEQYLGLSFWSPNINIYRDPRWGRGQETYGEDPYLTSQIGVAFVQGLQGNEKETLKTSACAKHFAVHSGPEKIRHSFDAKVDEKDLRETYLYAFKKLVDAQVEAVMCAYNRVNGEPCCTGNTLLKNILKNEYRFKGHVVTDCWALEDIRSGHGIEKDGAIIAAAAIKAGVNLDCSRHLQTELKNALNRKLISEVDINEALRPILITQAKLGLLKPEGLDNYRIYGEDSIANDYHRFLARKIARESMVLLKNDAVLPLQTKNLKSLMLIGPRAADEEVLLGNYHGLSSELVSFAEGLTAALPSNVRLEYDKGCDDFDTTHFGGIWAAGNAEYTIAFIGSSPIYEGEDGDAFLSKNGGDGDEMKLIRSHEILIQKLKTALPNKKLIVVICGGSAYDLSAIEPYSDAIILAWYPGEQGGNALADLVFGKYAPSGKLPISYIQDIKSLPAFNNYSMHNRTYRYHSNKLKYPFGYGLSYGKIDYKWVTEPKLILDSLVFTIQLSNFSDLQAADVAQVYISYPKVERMPIKELKAFQKVILDASNTQLVHFSIPIQELDKWDLQKSRWKLYEGDYYIQIGSSSEELHLKSKIKLRKQAR